jgi:hypothetical protein
MDAAASPVIHDLMHLVTKNRLWELFVHDRMLACESLVVLIGESGQLQTVRTCWESLGSNA